MSVARDLIVRALKRLTGVEEADAGAAAPSPAAALSEEALIRALDGGGSPRPAEVRQDSVPVEATPEVVEMSEPIELDDVEEPGDDVLESVTPPLGTPVPHPGNGAAAQDNGSAPVIQVGLQVPPMMTSEAAAPPPIVEEEPAVSVPASEPAVEESTPVIEVAQVHEDDEEETTVEGGMPIIEVSPDREIAQDDASRLASVLKKLERVSERDEIAEMVLEYSQQLFGRSALFVIKRDMVAGWEGRGAGMTRKNIRAILIPLTTPSIFKTVFETKVLYYGGVPRTTVNDLFLNAVATQSTPSRVVVLPFVLKGKVVCTLYADGAQAEDLSPRMIGQLYQLGRSVSAAFEQLILKTKQARTAG